MNRLGRGEYMLANTRGGVTPARAHARVLFLIALEASVPEVRADLEMRINELGPRTRRNDLRGAIANWAQAWHLSDWLLYHTICEDGWGGTRARLAHKSTLGRESFSLRSRSLWTPRFSLALGPFDATTETLNDIDTEIRSSFERSLRTFMSSIQERADKGGYIRTPEVRPRELDALHRHASLTVSPDVTDQLTSLICDREFHWLARFQFLAETYAQIAGTPYRSPAYPELAERLNADSALRVKARTVASGVRRSARYVCLKLRTEGKRGRPRR